MELTLIITGLLATVAGLVILAAAAVAGLAAGSTSARSPQHDGEEMDISLDQQSVVPGSGNHPEAPAGPAPHRPVPRNSERSA